MARAIEIGKFHTLNVVEHVAGGILLGTTGDDLFLPTHLIPADVQVGLAIEAFIYCDHDGRPQATTRVPAAVVGEFAYLKCVSVTRAGAYLAWGVPKDLYVPPDEQALNMIEGRSYVAAICLDRKGERLIASTHLSKHFDYDVGHLAPDVEVDLLVYGQSEAGVQVVVDRCHRGLIHHSDVFRKLPHGSEHHGYVRQVREDNRLDIVLTRRGVDGIQDAQAVVVAALTKAGGSLALHDRSPPAEIERALGMSKKAFKRAIGGLYKDKRIVIDERGISLVEPALP